MYSFHDNTPWIQGDNKKWNYTCTRYRVVKDHENFKFILPETQQINDLKGSYNVVT